MWRLVQPPLKRRIEELKQEVRRLSGLKKLDLCSPKDVGDMLFQTLGLPVPSCAMRGPGRNPSTNNEVRCLISVALKMPRQCWCISEGFGACGLPWHVVIFAAPLNISRY